MKKTFNPLAIFSYFGAISVQFTLIVTLLHIIQIGILNKISLLNLPLTISLKLPKFIVGFLFLFLSLRSRIFSPLSNPRPQPNEKERIFLERARPSWCPPPKAFAIIWSAIAIQRTIATTIVYSTKGTLLTYPIYSLILHYSIGDTWNTINNVENRLGTSFIGSLFVWSSVLFTVIQYYKTNTLAGIILTPSLIWLTIASVLINSIWRLNYEKFHEPSLFPSKEEGPLSKWRFPLTTFNE